MVKELLRRVTQNRLLKHAARFVPEGMILSQTIGRLPISEDVASVISQALVDLARSRELTIAQLIFEEDIAADIEELIALFEDVKGKFNISGGISELSAQNKLKLNERIDDEDYHS